MTWMVTPGKVKDWILFALCKILDIDTANSEREL